MATHIFRGGNLYIAENSFSEVTRSFAIDIDVEAVDATVINDTTRIHAPGLTTATWSAELLHDPAYDAVLNAYAIASGTSRPVLLTYYPSAGAAENELVYFMRAQIDSVGRPWSLGEMALMTVAGSAGGRPSAGSGVDVVQGWLSSKGTAVASSGVGTGRQLGALATARTGVSMSGHVTAITGTASITFTLQSDDNSGFTTPTTRATSSAINTTADFIAAPAVGPITDDYWRVIYTITGTGTVTFRTSMGLVRLR